MFTEQEIDNGYNPGDNDEPIKNLSEEVIEIPNE